MHRSLPTIHIYSTLSRQLEELQPLHGNLVNLFVCGPTVYDYSHLGHGKTYTQFDFIARYLRHRGYEVFYLQNITNIDDKIIDRAKKQGMAWDELANLFEGYYHEDMAALHNTAANTYARATDYMTHIIRQVNTLMSKGFAYCADDGIYYEVAKFVGYGKLSGRTHLEQNDAVSRIDESKSKRGWNDFCLWKFAKPDEPSWDAPFGAGRPGWHIEDTAITESFFGPQYDIHGGAIDLIFPHHEAEIAQMEAASGKEPLVRIWMHGGFLNTGSQKMSKSLGNFTTIRDILTRYDYRTLRYLFLSGHYRSSLTFTETALDQAKANVQRFDEFIFSIDKTLDDAGSVEAIEALKKKVYRALDTDFNTPAALTALHAYMKQQNSTGTPGKFVWELFRELNGFFDFMQFDDAPGEADQAIGKLVEERDRYRSHKQFDLADRIRKELEARGVRLYDTEEGTKWRRV